MAEFTSGERRGLIVLLVILACLSLVLLFRQGFVWNNVESAGEVAGLRIESIEGSGADVKSVPDSVARKGRKGNNTKKVKKSASRKSSAPQKPPRNPLDEEVN